MLAGLQHADHRLPGCNLVRDQVGPVRRLGVLESGGEKKVLDSFVEKA